MLNAEVRQHTVRQIAFTEHIWPLHTWQGTVEAVARRRVSWRFRDTRVGGVHTTAGDAGPAQRVAPWGRGSPSVRPIRSVHVHLLRFDGGD